MGSVQSMYRLFSLLFFPKKKKEYNNYLYNIYIVLGITGNLKMI
jgi:hypothetical protein